jgi:surface protein
MAIPGGNQNFTPTPIVGDFLPPNDLPYNPLSQIIWGGIAINNATEGRQYQFWEVFYDDSDIKMKPITGSVEFQHTAPNAFIVSGAFDQNMAAVVSWVDTSRNCSIYFFGPSGYTTLTVSDVTSMRLVIDDSRDYYSAGSDIFWSYVRNDVLCYRIQRENYATEYQIGAAYGKQIQRVGLTDKNRVQFDLLVSEVPPLPPPSDMVLIYTIPNDGDIVYMEVGDFTSGNINNITVDWGDGNIENTGNFINTFLDHTYATSGNKTVTITGTLNGFLGGSQYLSSALSWGNTGLTRLSGAFAFATNVNFVASPPPTVTNISFMFGGAGDLQWDYDVYPPIAYTIGGSFNADLSTWDTSNITIMERVFSYAAFDGDISGWDVGNVIDFGAMFEGSIFNSNIGGWNTSSATNMSDMFRENTIFNQYIGNWNTSNVDNMNSMFDSAISFNQDISGWDTSSVDTMSGMFSYAYAFNQDISGWDVSVVRFMDSMFEEALSFNQDLSGWCVTNITSEPSSFATNSPLDANIAFKPQWGTCPSNNIVLEYTLPLGETSLTMPLYDATTDAIIDWGDGNVSIVNDPADDRSHIYATSGVKTVTISGIVPHFGADSEFEVDSSYLTSVISWGNVGLTSLGFACYRADNIASIPSPPSTVTDTQYMFYLAGYNFGTYTGFPANISGWDTTNITNMEGMFKASGFNGNIASWNTSNVTNMAEMFNTDFGSVVFNQYIGDWDTSNVTTMNSMFRNTANFNQDIGSWDVSNVTDMNFMFESAAAFNQDLSGWCVTNIPEEPVSFAISSPLDTNIAFKPIWGTCP